MPYNRYGKSGGNSRRQFDRDFESGDTDDFVGPGRKRSNGKRKRPGASKRRSAEFRAGQAHERAKLARALDAPDTGYERDYGNGNGNGRGRGDREVNASRVRIGYRL